MIKLSKIKPNPRNPRTITDVKFKKLCESIEKFPEMMALRPMVVDKDMIVLGGNMRLRALNHLGFKEIPDNWIIQADDLTDEQKREFVIKDNVGFGVWDFDELTNEYDLSELDDWALDIPDDIFSFEPEEKKEESDEVPEPPEEPTAKLGDIYQLGEHRLMCGDSTDAGTVALLMDGKKADMVFTDPPYEIEVQSNIIDENINNGNIFIFQNDREVVKYLKQSTFIFKKFFIFYHGGVAIPQEGGKEPFLRHIIITHEMKGKSMRLQTKEGLSSVIKSKYRHEKDVHKHMKAVESLTPIIRGYSVAGNIVLDLFGGSGTMVIACEETSRKCYMMELDPRYIDVIIKRWENLTGKKATRIE